MPFLSCFPSCILSYSPVNALLMLGLSDTTLCLPLCVDTLFTLFRFQHPTPPCCLSMRKLSSLCLVSHTCNQVSLLCGSPSHPTDLLGFRHPHIKLSPSIAWMPSSHHSRFYNLFWFNTAFCIPTPVTESYLVCSTPMALGMSCKGMGRSLVASILSVLQQLL